jgi:hypothetical protein
MTVIQPIGPSQVPDACTLPTAQQPLRVAEFDELFQLVTGAARPDPASLHLTLPAEPGAAAQAADLAVRETRCCDFFTFTLTVRPQQLELVIETPAGPLDVLDALHQRVQAARRA